MKPKIPLEKIFRIVCEYCGVDEKMVRSVSKKAEFVKARQIYFYLAYEWSGCTFDEIGDTLSRDHCTVLYAHNKIRVQHQIYYKLANEISEVTAMILKPSLVVEDINLLSMSENHTKSFITP